VRLPAARASLIATGDVLLAWAAVLALETVVVGGVWRGLFAGSWEMALARRQLAPVAFAALAPLALLAPAAAAVVARAEKARAARLALAATVGALGALEGWGVTFGRHFASWAVRGPFIAALAGLAGALAWTLAPRAAEWARARPRAVATAGALVAAAAWWADAVVLPRLYPAFHLGLEVVILGSSALVPLAWRANASRRRAPIVLALLLAAAVGAASAPRAARRLQHADNLRLVLLEHAPLLGRAVLLTTWLTPPPQDDAPADDGAAAPPPASAARALDWGGRDILFVTIDALRADHTHLYGYARPTTPNLDRLASEGMTFDWAYCPTPHTSYSITSMMTGKYMRPLLALGAGADSETWASYARHYGYRTAAFYPPAVFFIDAPRFTTFRDRGLDFEYRKVEFADPELRVAQLGDYLARAPKDKPIFAWVHLFEPHEPYVMHARHPFGPREGWTDVDAYDSEIAETDAGLGELVATFRATRPSAVIMVTADHGEEFGDHGGRYHGTTVYEEQVRVPLVVIGPGVRAGTRSSAVVQTIDLLPTTLSALGVPRAPRLRGRDLGPSLTKTGDSDEGLAFAETDDYTLTARGEHRLVCARKAAACRLYDAREDPREARDRSGDRPDVVRELRRMTRSIERDNGRFEAGEGTDLPEALRRGLQGDADAADDVAALLDDAKVAVRRRAAAVLFELRAPSSVPQLRRALARDEDDEVRRYAALALVRAGARSDDEAGAIDAALPLAEALVSDPQRDWRRRAALAFAERGDARGEAELVAWWDAWSALSFEEARAVLRAIARIKAKSAVPALSRALSDVRLRSDVADALGALGDARAKGPLLDAFARERYVSARPHEARALVRLGARAEMAAPLARFAGLPEPMPDALALARDAGLLTADRGGWTASAPTRASDARLRGLAGSARLLVLVATAASEPRGALDGAPVVFTHARGSEDGPLWVADVEVASTGGTTLHLEDDAGLVAAWLVAPAKELPPPPPEAWNDPDGGASDGGEAR
jgi:arylsulfatase A-like enzyme